MNNPSGRSSPSFAAGATEPDGNDSHEILSREVWNEAMLFMRDTPRSKKV
jgi:hypothetical protein